MIGQSLTERMKAQRQDLVKRREEQAKEKTSGRFGTVFIREKLPEGRGFWSAKEGQHLVDIVPFVAGNSFPPLSRVRQGDIEYAVDFWVHQGVGPADDQFMCPSWNFKQPCPICEYLNEIRNSGNLLPKEEYSRIRAKNRTAYLVWVHDTPEEERKGLQIWEIASFFFQEKLQEISKDALGGGIILFEDPTEGKSISFRRKGKGQGNTEYLGHRFTDRRSPIPNDILDQSFSLDEVIKWKPTYEEIKAAFFAKKAEKTEPVQEKREPIQEPKREPAPEPKKETVLPSNIQEKREPDTSNRCPAGGIFGVEIDKHDNCHACVVWDDCDQEHIRIRREATKPEHTSTDSEPKKLRRRLNA